MRNGQATTWRSNELLRAEDNIAVKELNLRGYPPIMENQMEKKMKNEMETGGDIGIEGTA